MEPKKSDIEKIATIDLEKHIPIGAGLGGGSSNAAGALIGLNELYNLGIDFEKLMNMALELGSDVPFFLESKPSIGRSRGEILEQIDFVLNRPILIINPGLFISTKEAFRKIIPKATKCDYNKIFSQKYDPDLFRKTITNDFEEYVFSEFPEVKEIKKKLYDIGAEFALMTGTGSTVFGIFSNLDDAENALNAFPVDYFSFISYPR